MKHCPKCFCEYEEWVQRCAECDKELVIGSVTEEQADFFKVGLSPGRHNTIMRIQICIIALTGFLLLITEYFAMKYIFKSGFWSQPVGLVSFQAILLFIFFYTLKLFSSRQKERDAFDKFSRKDIQP